MISAGNGETGMSSRTPAMGTTSRTRCTDASFRFMNRFYQGSGDLADDPRRASAGCIAPAT